jgi:hypothetical protein
MDHGQVRGRVLAQVVSRRPLQAEAWVRVRISPCGIYVGQIVIGTGLSLSSSVLSCQYHSTVTHHTLVSSGERTIYPLMATVRRYSLIPATWTIRSRRYVPIS